MNFALTTVSVPKWSLTISNFLVLIPEQSMFSVWAYQVDLFKPKFGEIDWDKIRAERNAAVDEAAEPEDDEDEEEEEEEAAEEGWFAFLLFFSLVRIDILLFIELRFS